MEDLHINMIINRKKKHKNTGNIIKEIMEIIDRHKVNVGTDEDFNSILDSFLLNYIKLSKMIEVKKDSIENEQVALNLIENIITKVENNDFMVPSLNIKRIEIEDKCRKHHDKHSDITIVMK